MACHLEHRLRWEVLRDIYMVSQARDPRVKCCPRKMSKELHHFAGCFVMALEEFRATDKSTDAEIRLFDPKVWGEYEFQSNCGGPWLGYYDSLFWGYLQLNLLLIDGERIAPLMIRDHRLPRTINVMIGRGQDEQPSHITGHLYPAFKDDKLAPLTPEIRKILRDHAAILFRCMYSVRGENKLLHRDLVRRLLFGFFNWSHRRCIQPEAGGGCVHLPSTCCPWTFGGAKTSTTALSAE